MYRTVICGDHSLVCLDVKDIFGTVAIKVNKIKFECSVSGCPVPYFASLKLKIKIEIKIVCVDVKDIFGAVVPWQPR
jgi:hypothetical protein